MFIQWNNTITWTNVSSVKDKVVINIQLDYNMDRITQRLQCYMQEITRTEDNGLEGTGYKSLH